MRNETSFGLRLAEFLKGESHVVVCYCSASLGGCGNNWHHFRYSLARRSSADAWGKGSRNIHPSHGGRGKNAKEIILQSWSTLVDGKYRQIQILPPVEKCVFLLMSRKRRNSCTFIGQSEPPKRENRDGY